MTIQIQNFNDFNCPYPILSDPNIPLRFIKKPCPFSCHLASTEEASILSIPSQQDTLHHIKPFEDSEEKVEGSSLKLLETSILPHFLQNKSATLLNPYPKHFSRKKKHSINFRSMVSPSDLLEESCTRALVPPLSLKFVQKSSPPHQFKQSILHFPNHNSKFQRDTRLSSPSHKKEKEFDSDIDSIASASNEELEKVEEEVFPDSLDQEINYSEELNALFQLKEKSQEGERERSVRKKSLPSSVIPEHLRSFFAECGLVLI